VTLIFLADAHLGAHPGDVETFRNHLERLHDKGMTQLVLLGDIFHYYIGIRSWQKLFSQEVLEFLAYLKARGVTIDYLEGNRDFFLRGSSLARSVTSIHRDLRIETGNGTIHVEHGDLINRKDRKYRLWRAISKSWLTRMIMVLVPPSLLRPLVDRMEKSLKKTNFQYRRQFPVKELKQFLADLDHIDLAVIGHFHEEAVIHGQNRTLLILPAWEDDHRALCINTIDDWTWETGP